MKRKLTEYNAKIEFIKEAFLDAERKTAVEIALVKVQFPKGKRESFILDGLRKAQEQREFSRDSSKGRLYYFYVRLFVLARDGHSVF